jgi:hypothetical protein
VIERVGEPAWRSDRAWYDLGPNGGHKGLVVYWEGEIDHSILMIHFDVASRRVERFEARRLPETWEERPAGPRRRAAGP